MRIEQDPLLTKMTFQNMVTSVGYPMEDGPRAGWIEGRSYSNDGRDNSVCEFVKYVNPSILHSSGIIGSAERSARLSSGVGGLVIELAHRNPAIPLGEVFDIKGNLVDTDFVYLEHQATGQSPDGADIELDMKFWHRPGSGLYLEKITKDGITYKGVYSNFMVSTSRVHEVLSDQYIETSAEQVRRQGIIPNEVLKHLDKTLETVSTENSRSLGSRLGHGIAHVADVAGEKTTKVFTKGGQKIVRGAMHIAERRHERHASKKNDEL